MNNNTRQASQRCSNWRVTFFGEGAFVTKPQNIQNKQKNIPDLDLSASSACSAVLRYFDQISEAPDAIPRLRRFILDLAVRGKLVEQDPKDEPGAELLKRIEVEKRRLEKMGQIKNGKHFESIEEGEIPFSVPIIWDWSRLGDITTYIQRGKSPAYSTGVGPPVISQKCVQWDGLHLEWAKSLVPESLEAYESIRFLQEGDLLWNSTGTGTIGRVIRVEHPDRPLVCDSHVTIIRCLLVYERFVLIWLRSDYVYGTIESRASGATKQVELTASMSNNQITPIPPLAEQHRIVAKVDELMRLCDELEAAQQKRERRRGRLITSSLTKLTDETENKSILKFSVSSACSAVSRPEHIQQLRQTILNLAVRGKLVPQDPKDEPAGELLRQIEPEKQRLIAKGTIKKINTIAQELENEHPFELPWSWLWERFGNIAAIQSNLVKPQDYPNHPHIAPDNIESKTGKLLPYVTIAESRVSSAKHLFFPKNIIYSKIRPNLAKATVVDFEGLCSADAYPIYPLLDIQYLLRFMLSEVFIQQSIKEDNRVAMPKINQESLNKIFVAVPPLAEQHRIVAKVNELMATCDELETRLTTTVNIRHQLLETTLHETLSVQDHGRLEEVLR